jgi:hypothetical protein
MGAWGIGIFENDSALDWVAELVEENDESIIYSTLASIDSNVESITDSYIEEPDATAILAAAEIVAYLSGNPSGDLPQEVVDWAEENKLNNLSELLELARSSVKTVKKNSELRELWEESDEFDGWLSVVEELERRLQNK